MEHRPRQPWQGRLNHHQFRAGGEDIHLVASPVFHFGLFDRWGGVRSQSTRAAPQTRFRNVCGSATPIGPGKPLTALVQGVE
jgi:hypothetical protein